MLFVDAVVKAVVFWLQAEAETVGAVPIPVAELLWWFVAFGVGGGGGDELAVDCIPYGMPLAAVASKGAAYTELQLENKRKLLFSITNEIKIKK